MDPGPTNDGGDVGGEDGRTPDVGDARRRRRARVAAHVAAARSPTRPADASERVAPAEHLRARLAATDREGRFRQRLDEVRRQDARRRRRLRVLRAGVVLLGVLACGIVGAVVGVLAEDGAIGTAVGLVAATAFLLGRVLVARAAEARGSEAWDWQAGRHRLLGRPARRVQALDEPRGSGPLDPRR